MRFPLLNIYRRVLQVIALIVIALGATFFVAASLKAEIVSDASEPFRIEEKQTFEPNLIGITGCFYSLITAFGFLLMAELVKLFLYIEEHLFEMRYYFTRKEILTSQEKENLVPYGNEHYKKR